jgi:transposase
MITREEDIDTHALFRRGWTVSAIARHTGRDRKTVRAYLRGDRVAGVRARTVADPFEPYAAYCTARLTEDPRGWATTLFDELLELGYDRSYPTFTRAVRARGLRPRCEPCRPAKDRPVAVIEHPPGDETQWDWVDLPTPPARWGWGATAHLLVGALAHSGRWRGWLSASMDSPHPIDGLDRVTATFAAVAKHHGVVVRPCPPRRGNRKGVVERANHVAAQRFWRTLPEDVTVEEAQTRLERWCATRGDVRLRTTADGTATVATVAAAEPLRTGAGGSVPGDPVRHTGGVGAGAGVVSWQPIQRRTRARQRHRHGVAPPRRRPPRHRHPGRDRPRPAHPRPGRGGVLTVAL